MATKPTAQPIPLRTPLSEAPAPMLADAPGRVETRELARRISRQLSIALPTINILEVALTFVFVVYVVPLPGQAAPASSRMTTLICGAVMTALGWLSCELWGRWSFAPVRRWLERGGEPDPVERSRATRLPLHEFGHMLVVWSIGATAFGVLDVVLGGPVAAGALILIMIVLGGLVASALSYLITERIMRPAIALALESGPPSRPLLPGIAARIYLAWEFGTAVAVCGAVVVAITYLAGASMSPHRMAATVIFLGGVALTVGLITLLVAIHSVSDPVRSLRRAMARVEEGETEITVRVDDGGEIGLLQAGFNRMMTGLRERDRVRELFGFHVGEEVARSALGRGIELGGELREAAVLFVDVVGSTSFAAARDPREVVETLNRFFEVVVEGVTLHGGWVNKFEGDAALCVFGAPSEHPDAAGAALLAARELRRRLERELDGLDAAIGLSAGEVVAGNIGAARRYEYTVIGDPVNEASRLTELAKGRPERLLASEAIVRRAGSREGSRWELGEPVVLRGRSTPTRVAAPV
jgi:adenylate cyclase